MLVERFRLPLPLKELVRTGVHAVKGKVTFVVLSKTNWPFIVPLVAEMCKVAPLTLIPVKIAGEGGTLVKVMPMTLWAVSSTRVPVVRGGSGAKLKPLKGSVPE